jgi:hypothetical protein
VSSTAAVIFVVIVAVVVAVVYKAKRVHELLVRQAQVADKTPPCIASRWFCTWFSYSSFSP